ncbi:hypothetical protein OZX74_01675 [Bifidobacterium sp. ESL0798]|uniref:hypothetical protein n=1 Tax=Bifidobacterium sp. ESL0798 TaxID=2983235 RepID=UPI0023F7EF8E|nr:hypothetical protein [Bifidobacterium sp. ESL0798]WEV74293.1 hypothetical protein OZX74_01675 [Bifidobacterium sp. ESL0798]
MGNVLNRQKQEPKPSEVKHKIKRLFHLDHGNEGQNDVLAGRIYVDNCFIDALRKSKDKIRRIRFHTLSGPITDTLRQMPHSRFEIFCYESRSAIRRWQINGSKRNTRNVGYCVMRAGTESTFGAEAKSLLHNTIIAAIIAAVSVGLDRLIPDNFMPLLMMVILSWVISVIPNVIDVYHWLKDVHTSGSTVLIDD